MTKPNLKENQVWIYKNKTSGIEERVKILSMFDVTKKEFQGVLSYNDGCTVHGYFLKKEFVEFLGYECLFPRLPSYTEAIINFVKNPGEQSEKLLRFVSPLDAK